ncbi:MAG: hypothetical protein SH868_06180, partial [Bythopirellula sp.]|nr:hypothetical protein [Bythopirellula sp.]
LSRWHVERTNRCFYKVWRKSRAIVREVIWEIRAEETLITSAPSCSMNFGCGQRPRWVIRG